MVSRVSDAGFLWIFQVGPTEYRSRTVFEDMTPELVRDFFWDDEFREHWDDMLIFTKTWEECEATGSTIGQWVRKVRIFGMLYLK